MRWEGAAERESGQAPGCQWRAGSRAWGRKHCSGREGTGRNGSWHKAGTKCQSPVSHALSRVPCAWPSVQALPWGSSLIGPLLGKKKEKKKRVLITHSTQERSWTRLLDTTRWFPIWLVSHSVLMVKRSVSRLECSEHTGPVPML